MQGLPVLSPFRCNWHPSTGPAHFTLPWISSRPVQPGNTLFFTLLLQPAGSIHSQYPSVICSFQYLTINHCLGFQVNTSPVQGRASGRQDQDSSPRPTLSPRAHTSPRTDCTHAPAWPTQNTYRVSRSTLGQKHDPLRLLYSFITPRTPWRVSPAANFQTLHTLPLSHAT